MEKTTKKGFKFSYDLTALPEYNSYGADMLIKQVLGLTLPKYSTIRPNLRGTTEKVGWLQNDIVIQDLACGFDPTGDTVQNLVTIDLCNRKINQTLCPYDLYDTYLSASLSNGNFQEEVPFAQVVIEDINQRIANAIETQLWLNTTATGATSYNSQCFDGMLALVTSGNGATQIAYTAATGSNGLDVFTKVYENIPQNVLHRNDLVIYCSYSDYRGLIASMRNSSYINLFVDNTSTGSVGEEWSVMLPGSNVRVIPTVGLTNQSAYVAGPAGYVMIGMNSELYETKMMYDPFADQVKINSHFSYGIGVFDVASFCLSKS